MGKTNHIWHRAYTIEELDKLNPGTLAESLGIKVTEIGVDFLRGEMPVNEKTKQPFGLLHGGASVALAETLGSIASLMVINDEFFVGLGSEISASHVKAVTAGKVMAICTPLHIKGKNHIWDIRTYNENGELTCVCRFTCSIIPKKNLPK